MKRNKLILLQILTIGNGINGNNNPLFKISSPTILGYSKPIQTRGGSQSPSGRSIEHPEEICDAICTILNHRLDMVITGERQALFSRKYRAHLDMIDGKYTTILSTHGRGGGGDCTPCGDAIKTKKQKLITRGGGKHSITREEDACSAICKILNNRLDSVMTGERQSQFSRKYRAKLDMIDGKYTIMSTHGRGGGGCTPCGDIIPAKKMSRGGGLKLKTRKQKKVKKSKEWDAFPDDITRLDIVLSNNKNNNDGEKTLEQKEEDTPSTIAVALRAMQLSLNFLPCWSTLGLAMISSKFRNGVWFQLLANSLGRSGPAFIKWGQWASTRSDMFPEELCTALSDLHANAPSHSWKYTQTSVEESLGIPKGSLFEVFRYFEPQPMASGSIAQVHRATLKAGKLPSSSNAVATTDSDANHYVAVKVRHPNVMHHLNMDFRLMSVLASLVHKFPSLRWLNIRASIDQFSHTMAAQAHLDVEAHHLEVLNHNFRNWHNVGFPQPIFASSSVIVETYALGSIVTEYIDLYEKQACESGKKNAHEVMPVSLSKFVVTKGLSIYLKMLLVDNLMHADLHPGNLMLHIHAPLPADADINPEIILQKQHEEEEGYLNETSYENSTIASSTYHPRSFHGHITMVDAGMVAQLDETESINFIGLLASIGEGDGAAAANAVLRFSSQNRYSLTPQQRQEFIQDMKTLFDTECRGYGHNVQVGDVLRSVLKLIREHHIHIDANYATLVVNALCVEGLAATVSPEYNLLDASKPLLKYYKKICKEGQCHKSILRQRIMKIFMPVLSLHKDYVDYRFFRRLERKRGRPKDGLSDRLHRVVKSAVAVCILGLCLRDLDVDLNFGNPVSFVRDWVKKDKESNDE